MLVWRKREVWELKCKIFRISLIRAVSSFWSCCVSKNPGFKGVFLVNIGQNKDIELKKSVKERKMENISKKSVSEGILDAQEMIYENIEKMALSENNKKVKCEFNLKTPKGTKDWDGMDMTIRENMFFKIMKIFKRHGGIAIDTPVFELREILAGKYGEDSKLIYDLQDQGGELCSLRYDLTVPFARYLAMNPTIQHIKRYHIAKVYRRDQPAITKGRMREFYQCDFDIAGCYDSMLPDTEILKILIEILEELNISNYVIKLNHRKILDGIFDISGVPNDKFRIISSAIDKLDKLSWDSVKKEMVEEKGLDNLVADKVGDYIRNKGGKDLLEKLKSDELMGKHAIALEGIKDMEILYKYLEYLDIDSKVLFDLSLARGLDYYTGLIYEAVLEPCVLFDPSSLKRKSNLNKDQEDFTCIGSIAAGGRYDNLVGMFSSKKNGIPCVGVSIGVERIFSILKSRFFGRIIKTNSTEVYVIELGAGSKSNMVKERLQICKELWDSGINAQFLYKTRPKLRQQFEAAEKDNVPIAVIFGQEEIINDQIRIKILGLGDQSNKGELVQRKDMVPKILNILKELSHDDLKNTFI
ncbi:histidine-tRNA ligase [Pneumocystis jirovecii RU7]|uniref:Histidine--tRNA ligase, mitochondrial n=1 Tax=Pneumocystis jirovecii (strain RU7) TaxID=1408657 RepID=A0A0W4ZTW1_PNEJ7|nr:histidine-tRNA ligase [Pneumocystis jirovecii RU7]KTW31802.1 histidine-tRNA ligase [Pneumocystis jirovecii RU7]